MKKRNWSSGRKWLTTVFLALAIMGLVWLIILWQNKKKVVIDETISELPKLQTAITTETLASLETNTNDESEEDPSVYGLTPTQAYLKMKNTETQIKTTDDYLSMIANYYDPLIVGEIWEDWYKLALEEEKVAYVQKKLAQVPRLNQLVEVTETIDLEMERAFLVITTNDNQKVVVMMNSNLTDDGQELWYVIDESFIK